MITVSMPWYRTPPELFERAVASVLGEEVRDIRLVVVGDGEEPPTVADDPRVATYVLPDNRGPYFCHQVVLEATPDDWFAVHDSDDWTEPGHLSALMALGTEAAVPGRIWWHDVRSRVRRPYLREGRWHYGLFRTEALLSIGGYDPSRRIANDNHTLRTLALVTEVAKCMVPTYHRMKRAGSLTSTPATSMQSPARRAERAHNRPVLEACERLRSAEAIREYRESLVPPGVRAEVDLHVERLRGLLS